MEYAPLNAFRMPCFKCYVKTFSKYLKVWVHGISATAYTVDKHVDKKWYVDRAYHLVTITGTVTLVMSS